MNSLLPLVKFSTKKTSSYSVLLDFQQIYIRNAILFCTGLSMFRLLFGENIICQVTESGVSQNFIETKCFINGTITKGNANVSTIYHDYYQWVSIYLLLLSFGFYFPYSIWSKCVGNYIQTLESLGDKPDEAVQVIKDSKGNFMYFKTWALEFFYLCYTFFILSLTNAFFNNLWSEFSWSWKAIYKIFPDSGTCNIPYFQSSGITDGWYNCLLPLCSVYRKVFGFFYGLIMILLLFNALMIFYRIKMLFQKKSMVNIWWAFMIVKQSTISWNTRVKLDIALKRIMEISTENLISLNIIPEIKGRGLDDFD